jgi:imidazolonepropionase
LGRVSARPVTRLFVRCKQLVTLKSGAATGARRGSELADVGAVADGAVAVDADGNIAATGQTAEIEARFPGVPRVDLSDYLVMPGFVDCHTHPVFAATREDEFHMRCAGADYMAIAAAGGGILNSSAKTRAASPAELAEVVEGNLDRFLEHGTTTIEAKSGYGLTTDSEVRSLQVLTDLMVSHPLTISRTFLGAHEFPAGFRATEADRERYVDLVIEEMLPAVVGLCESCDVFAEPKVFNREQARRIMLAAKRHDLGLRLHVDEILPMGGAELAVELGADSADHLGRVSLQGMEALAASSTTAVLLPGTTFFLGKPTHAPARRMIDAGCAVALATDFNPGSCYTQSMPLIITLACVLLKMTPEECIHATTINPAASLGLDDRVGTLHDGKRADLCVMDLPSYRALGYQMGGNRVVMTVVGGEPVMVNSHDRSVVELDV